MVICSKLDTMLNARVTARLALEAGLSTKRGTRASRSEAKRIVNEALATNICQACGGPLLAHAKTDGYCRTCRARFDRMLNFKSKLKKGAPKNKALQRFIEDYRMSTHLPYSLRGAAPRELILQYAEDLIRINNAIDAKMRESVAWGKEAAAAIDEGDDAAHDEEL